jgi:NADH:ubiquinone oxidoreductase subunit 6 (subunit J)
MEQMIPTLIFAFMAALLIGLSIIVVTSRSVFHSAIALTAALGVVAGLFALLGADFVAAGQLLIYVGGIMVIMLFVIMLSQKPAQNLDRQTNDQWLWGILFALAVTSGLIIQFRAVYRGVLFSTEASPTSAAIGRLLLGDMVIPFEAISLVLLAALVGAIYYGQDYPEKP